MAENRARSTIVFIHGLWLHTSTWDPWIAFFKDQGYDAINPPWPGEGATVEASRANPDAAAGFGVTQIADRYAVAIASLARPPILIGHSFGGLIAQILLGRGIAAGAIAIDPAPMKGVWQLPVSALRVASVALRNPANRKRSVALTYEQFRYGFANAVDEQEARDLYDRCAIPSPGRPLFQAASATFNRHAETAVDTGNTTRGPLLLTSGDKDHTVPPVLVKSALKRYSGSPAITEMQTFTDRGHSLTIDHGWQDVASASLDWLRRQEI